VVKTKGMKAEQIFEMIFSTDSADRLFAKKIVENLIDWEHIQELTDLDQMLKSFSNYPGYEIILDKEEVEEKIERYLKGTL
jgi:hypothetical protein